MKKQSEYKGPEYPTQPHGSIPAFNSYEEEATFWDTHDFTDFSQETTPVKIHSTRGLTKQLMIRFDEETDRVLEAFAEQEEIKKSTLVRKIVKQWVREQQQRHAS